jgi:hypothetical protein
MGFQSMLQMANGHDVFLGELHQFTVEAIEMSMKPK